MHEEIIFWVCLVDIHLVMGLLIYAGLRKEGGE